MTGKVKKTVLLTSRENFVLAHGMQEIIPFIEQSWLSAAAEGRHEVKCLNVDQQPISKLMPELLAADNVVFTCFTVKLCKIGELLRRQFALDARYFVYLHNQATIACWPLHWWGMGGWLREDDVFVSSSTADAETMKHSFERSRVEIVPFTLSDLKLPLCPVPLASKTLVRFRLCGAPIRSKEPPHADLRLSVLSRMRTLG